MTQETRLAALATAIGTDIKALTIRIGDLTTLSTTAKDDLVAAINELYAAIGGAGAQIDDNAGDGDTLVTWSADKIFDSIAAAQIEVKDDILGGAGPAYDTLKELQDLLVESSDELIALTTAVANRVRYDDAQSLTNAQKIQARTNIGAVGASDVDAQILAKTGDVDRDLVAVYNAAKV